MEKLRKLQALGAFIFLFFLSSCYTLEELQQKVDLSASEEGLAFLEELKTSSKSEEVLASQLDKILESTPFVLMFHHYNRTIRPNELPKEVFRDMILSLRFKNRYVKGTNKRADVMKPLWEKAYAHIDFYKQLTEELAAAETLRKIAKATQYAESWVPSDMKVPDSYFFILPQGGSDAFIVPFNKSSMPSQGFDLFAVASPEEAFTLKTLLMKAAHETHHLAYQNYFSEKSWGPTKMFLALTVAEGVANAVFNDLPNGKGKSFGFSKLYREELSESAVKEWNGYRANCVNLMKRYLQDSKKLREKFDHSIMDFWWEGKFKQRLYYIGVEAVHRAYEKRGKQGVFELMKNPILLLSYLEEAI